MYDNNVSIYIFWNMMQGCILALQRATKLQDKVKIYMNAGKQSHKHSFPNSQINKLSSNAHIYTSGEEKLIFKAQYHT